MELDAFCCINLHQCLSNLFPLVAAEYLFDMYCDSETEGLRETGGWLPEAGASQDQASWLLLHALVILRHIPGPQEGFPGYSLGTIVQMHVLF